MNEKNKIKSSIPKILQKRKTWKPISYKWALDAKLEQEHLHWLPHEVDMSKDKQEFYQLSLKEQNTLIRILRFFTQADLNVAEIYVKYYIPFFVNCPEISMMLTSFASMEGIHIIAYNLLLTTLNLPEADMSYIQKYEALMNKQNFMAQFSTDSPEETSITMAIVSGFVEGCVLFSSFAIINYFPHIKKVLKGVGQIVTLSIKDENLHTKSLIKLFHVYTKEIGLSPKKLEERIHSIVRNLITIEKNFINFCFSDGDLEQLSRQQLYDFIEYIADTRLRQLGLSAIYGYEKSHPNPLPWTNMFLSNMNEDTNFFENKPTEYCSAAVLNKGSIKESSWS